jgi:N-acetylglucosaminyldiphosphoundecaprenol N-acetyl-beta-D-mannosaminyltransferase
MNHYQKINQVPAPQTATIGGLEIAVLDRTEAAQSLLQAAYDHQRGSRPLHFTSANGEVIARIGWDAKLASLFEEADQIVADGQPLVIASRFLCKTPLPERVATTDLFHDVAEMAERTGQSFYFLGATPVEVARAVRKVRRAYPRLNIIGHSHGYLRGEALYAKLEQINTLAPDVIWLALGVPNEQRFVRAYGDRLPNVGVIKTAGGLFNFLSGKNKRAPYWMQRFGLEWAYRLWLEPGRLAWRYLTTNPKAMFLI